MSRTKISLPHEFVGRDYQLRYMAHLDNGGKRAVCVWHRRAGKDLTSLHQMNKMAHERKGMYWHCLPSYRQAKKAIWDGFTRDGRKIIDSVFPPAIVKRKNESEMMVELKCGSMVQLVGSDSIDSLVGAGPAGVTFSEYSISKPRTWDLVRPMLAENGGWASFIYTPRGNNHGKRLYDIAKTDPKWFCELLTIKETGALPLSILEEERAAGMPEALIRQEYLCDWTAALVGSVWGDLIEKLEKGGFLDAYTHERDGVFTTWDLGISDSTAIWFWRLKDDGVDFIDYYEARGQSINHYFDVVEGKETEATQYVAPEVLARMREYKYIKHWLPHDANNRTLATGVSILNQVMERVGDLVEIGPRLSLMDGVQAGRWLLQQNVRFHSRCRDGIEALKQYHYEYDEDKRIYSNKPEHDWSSHAADALRYAACVVRVSNLLRKPNEETPVEKIKTITEMCLEDLFEDHEQEVRSRELW